MGVWIETGHDVIAPYIVSHTLRGCVDWNMHISFSSRNRHQSHPTWVCGLKHKTQSATPYGKDVTPYVGVWIETKSGHTLTYDCGGHTLRGCVDWNNVIGKKRCGVWSHPTWVCGLKLSNLPLMRMASKVTPYVGVWIETPWYLLYLFLPGSHTLRGCVDWNTHMWLFSKP